MLDADAGRHYSVPHMRSISCTNRSTSFITLVVTGLLICCLFNSTPIVKSHLACAEIRVLDLEVEADDKGDSSQPEFTSTVSNDHFGSLEPWQHIDGHADAPPSRAKRESDLVRGSPVLIAY